MPNRVIFLDIDGVLNSHAWFNSLDCQRLDDLDPRSVGVLNTLVERSQASVVISSSWRKLHALVEIVDFLRMAGFRHWDRVLDVTPDLYKDPYWERDRNPVRGDEIQRWLDEHPGVADFVILDDDADMAHLKSRLVQTDMSRGLCLDHVAPALKLLGVEV